MNFKDKYLLGQCSINHIDDCAAEWHSKEHTDGGLMEYLGLTEPEYEEWLRSGNSNLFEQLLDNQRRQQHFRIYQLDFDEGQTTIPFAFCGIDSLHKAGYEQPPAANYRLICEHMIVCPNTSSNSEVLEQIFKTYNNQLPEDYHGRSLSPSDIVELYSEKERIYFYRDTDKFVPVRFSPFLTKPLVKNEFFTLDKN